MRGYDASEFAAEYLIRNDDFVAECGHLALQGAGAGELIGTRDFVIRWGARFHGHRRRISFI
ncbi:transcriptional regulator domain-containing protein [Mesorhizobium shangrilense]